MVAIPCNFMACSQKPSGKWMLSPPISALSARLLPTYVSSPCNHSNPLNLNPRRFRRLAPGVDRVVADENEAVLSSSFTSDFSEMVNGWLWEVDGVKLLVDPILVGNLEFGVPWLYNGAKKFLNNFQLSDLPEVDCLLITLSLDDHCHLKTLKPLSAKNPNLRVVATPNAKALLDPLFTNETEITGRNGSKVIARATPGTMLGPPWQRPKNGYIISSPQCQLSLYYEPHCAYNESILKKEHADIVITPVIKQLLLSFTLVSGQEDAVKLAKLLNAKFVVPMNNGDLDSKGLIASLVRGEGTIESFKDLLSKELPGAQVLEPVPGVPLRMPLA